MLHIHMKLMCASSSREMTKCILSPQLKVFTSQGLACIRERSLRMLQARAEVILLGYENIFAKIVGV